MSIKFERCFNCRDLGFIVRSQVMPCWRLGSGVRHNRPNAAADMIRRAAANLLPAELVTLANDHVMHLLAALANATSEAPLRRDDILEKHFGYVTPSARLRRFHYVVEDLRRVWLLPIGSRKDQPSGYWIVTDEADFKEWFERYRSAPLTQLTTLHHVARRNFPVFARQLEIDFKEASA